MGVVRWLAKGQGMFTIMESYRKSGFGRNLASCAALVAGLGAVAAGCGDKGAANAAAAGGPMPCRFRSPKRKKIPDTSEFLSVLKSRHSSAINPQVEGQIVKIL